MKAAVLEKYGSPDQFVIKEMLPPEPGPRQVLIRNHASSVNPVDTLIRQGKLKLLTGLIGDQIIGSDFSGEVIESQSTLFKSGDQVYGFVNALKGGAYADQVVVDEDQVSPKPRNINFTEAAVLPLVGCTAWQALIGYGKLKASDRVVINGCTGGVGSAAVQIAKQRGADVTGICSDKHLDYAYSLGCDEVINYHENQTPQDNNYDLIFEVTGNFSYSDFKECMKDNARFVSTRIDTSDIKSVAKATVDLVRGKTKVINVKAKMQDLVGIKKLVENGSLKPQIVKSFPLSQLNKAHEMMENQSFPGKIAIEI